MCLEIALIALDGESVDETICLGDVANLGPRPAGVIDLCGIGQFRQCLEMRTHG